MSSNAYKSVILDQLRRVQGFDKQVADRFFQDLHEAVDESRGDRPSEVDSNLVSNRARSRASSKV